jgi:hypothetical protein
MKTRFGMNLSAAKSTLAGFVCLAVLSSPAMAFRRDNPIAPSSPVPVPSPIGVSSPGPSANDLIDVSFETAATGSESGGVEDLTGMGTAFLNSAPPRPLPMAKVSAQFNVLKNGLSSECLSLVEQGKLSYVQGYGTLVGTYSVVFDQIISCQ